MHLRGKVSIIAGGALGIVPAVARRSAADGTIVALADLEAGPVHTAADVLCRGGAPAEGFAVDVTRREQVRSTVQQLRARCGRGDVLVNNAGVTVDARLRTLADALFDAVVAVNLKGTHDCTRAVVETNNPRGSRVMPNAASGVGMCGDYGQINGAAGMVGVTGRPKSPAG